MGDKKKHKQKERKKSKKKQKEKKNKEKKRSRDSSSQSDSSSPSRSRQKEKKKSKTKKIQKQQSQNVKTPNPAPDYFATLPSHNFPGVSPFGSRNMPPPVAPPPPSTVPVPKIKTKQVNIFKLLPKLPYGTTLIGRTLFSSQLISNSFHVNLFKQACSKIQKVVKTQNNKKAISMIVKCTTELQKLQKSKLQEQVEKQKEKYIQGESRYQTLTKIYEKVMKE